MEDDGSGIGPEENEDPINKAINENISQFRKEPQQINSDTDKMDEVMGRIKGMEREFMLTQWPYHINDLPLSMVDRFSEWLADMIGRHRVTPEIIASEVRHRIIMRQCDDICEEMNQTYWVCESEGGKLVVGRWGTEKNDPIFFPMPPADFRESLANQKVVVGFDNNGEKMMPKGRFWMNHPNRRQYQCMTFDPNDDSPVIRNRLNMWKGLAFKPREGDWSLIQKHIFEVLSNGDQESYDYIMKWAAFAVQYPGKIAEVAIVFRGGQGSGKGSFGRLMKDLFGIHSAQFTKQSDASGKFNGHHRGVCLAFFDEVVRPKDAAGASTLKAMLTEPVLYYENKQKTPIKDNNYMKVIMATNHDWAVPVELDDRRFAIFDTASDYKADYDYFEKLNEQIMNGGTEAFLHALLSTDISGWHPRKNIPDTKARYEQKMMSLDPPTDMIRSLLESAEMPYIMARRLGEDVIFIRTQDILMLYKERTNRLISVQEAGNLIKKIGIEKPVKFGPINGWILPNINEARAAFSKNTGIEFDCDYELADEDAITLGWNKISLKGSDNGF